jgi:hypothetical protein
MGATPGPERHEALICTATGKSGNRCQAFKAAGSEVCRFHSPEADGDRAKARAAARQATTEEANRLRLDTPEQIKALIEETASRLRAGTIHAGAALALDRLARTALSAIEARQLEEATAELAERRAQQGPVARRRR